MEDSFIMQTIPEKRGEFIIENLKSTIWEVLERTCNLDERQQISRSLSENTDGSKLLKFLTRLGELLTDKYYKDIQEQFKNLREIDPFNEALSISVSVGPNTSTIKHMIELENAYVEQSRKIANFIKAFKKAIPEAPPTEDGLVIKFLEQYARQDFAKAGIQYFSEIDSSLNDDIVIQFLKAYAYNNITEKGNTYISEIPKENWPVWQADKKQKIAIFKESIIPDAPASREELIQQFQSAYLSCDKEKCFM